MRKTLLTIGLILLSVAFVYGTAGAAVTGVCSNCHTMHYSQGNTQLSTWGTAGPYEGLLTNTCLGCHTTTGTDPLVNGYPYVKTTGTFSNYLAGGYFSDAGASHDGKSHSLGSTQSPAGLDSSEDNWYTGTTDGLSCAGTNGCHGNQTDLEDMTAIKGEHHKRTTYRILYVGTSAVGGIEASDFEEALNSSPSSDDAYNKYSGATTSISELCAKCHSDFHGSEDVGGTSSPFKRHPTDQAIPSDWDIYTSFSTEYDATARKYNPLGFTVVGTESAATAKVICVSCHRAHGSDQNDNLRFDYTGQIAGSSTMTDGCLACHNKQRG